MLSQTEEYLKKKYGISDESGSLLASMKKNSSSYTPPKTEKVTARFSPIPKNEIHYLGQTEDPNSTYPQKPSSSAVLRTLPDSVLGGAQYNFDPQNPNTLIKSYRKENAAETEYLRNGLPGFAFQIDHKMPLWAGGADTTQNKQILSTVDHEKKTKVDAVARTLYYNGKINLNGARIMMMNWKNVDTNIAPALVSTGSEEGELDQDQNKALQIAQKVKTEWDKPKQVKVTLGDVWNEAKNNPLVRGAQAALSAFSFGLIPKNEEAPAKGQETATAIAEGAGELVGSLVGFGKVAKGLEFGAKTVGFSNLAGKWAQRSKLLRGSEISIGGGKIAVSADTKIKVVKNAGIFSAIGQISESIDESRHPENSANFSQQRMNRFLSDVAMGSIVSVPGKALKTYATVAAATYTLDKVQGASTPSALFNSALMVGFHKLGEPAREVEIQKKATTGALKYRIDNYNEKPFGTVTDPKTGQEISQDTLLANWEKNPANVSWSAEDLAARDAEIFKQIDAIAKNRGDLTAAEVRKEKENVVTTSRQLYKSGLGVEKSLSEDIADLKSMYRRENASKNALDTGMSEGLKADITSRIDRVMDYGNEVITSKQAKFQRENSAKFVTGDVEATGMGVKTVGKEIERAVEAGVKEGDAAILVRVPDSELYMKEIDKDQPLPAQHGNPSNVIAVYVPMEGDFVMVGKIASFERAGVRKFNLKTSLKDVREVEPKINKDTIAQAMEDTQAPYLVAEIIHIGKAAKKSQLPHLGVHLTPESYSTFLAKGKPRAEGKYTEMSKDVFDIYIGPESNYGTLAEKAKAALDSTYLSGRGRSKMGKPARRVWSQDFEKVMKDLDAVVKRGQVEEVKKELHDIIGMDVSTATAKKFIKSKDATVGEVLRLVRTARGREESMRQKAIFMKAALPKTVKPTIKESALSLAKKVILRGKKTKTELPAAEKEQKVQKAKAAVAKAPSKKERLQSAREIVSEIVERDKRGEPKYISPKEGEILASAKTKTAQTSTASSKLPVINLDKVQAEERQAIEASKKGRIDKARNIITDISGRNRNLPSTGSVFQMRPLKKAESAEAVKTLLKEKAVDLGSSSLNRAAEKVLEGKPVNAETKAQVIKTLPQKLSQLVNAGKKSLQELKKTVEAEGSDRQEMRAEDTQMPKTQEGDPEINRALTEAVAEVKEKGIKSQDFTSYDGGIQRALGQAFDKKALKLRNSGKKGEARSLDARKKKYTRENLTKAAKALYQKEGSMDKAFEEFAKRMSSDLTNLGEKDPLADKKIRADLLHHFNVMVQGKPVKRVRITKEGIETVEETPEAASALHTAITRELGENSKFEVLYADDGGSTFDLVETFWGGQRLPTRMEKAQQIIDKVNAPEGKYFTFGAADKEPHNLMLFTRSKKLENRFDADASKGGQRYLAEGENAKSFSSRDKQVRVFAVDVLGFDKSEGVAKMLKRLKVLDARDTQINVKGKTYKEYNFKSPTFDDFLSTLTPEERKAFQYDIRPEDREAIGKLTIFNGQMWAHPETMNQWTEGLGMYGVRNRVKPKISYFTDTDGRARLVLQKGDMSAWDDFHLRFFEKLAKRQDPQFKGFGKDDIISFDENFKVGAHAQNEGGGEIFQTLDMPSEAIRLEFENQHASGGSIGSSILSMFRNSDQLNASLKESFRPIIEDYTKLIEELDKSSSGKEVEEIFAKYKFTEHLFKNLPENTRRKLQNGAGVNLLNKPIHNALKNAYVKEIDKGGFLKDKSLHATLSTDIGVKEGGKFLLPPRGKGKNRQYGEIGMSKEALVRMLGHAPERDKDYFVLVARYPNVNKTSASMNKVVLLDADHLPREERVTSLHDNRVVLNHQDVLASKQADTDGDTVHIVLLGEEGGLPLKLGQNIEAERAKEKSFVPSPMTKFPSVPVTGASLDSQTSKMMLGADGIEQTSATRRAMEAIVDAGTVIRTTDHGGKKAFEFFRGSEKEPLFVEVTKTPFQEEDTTRIFYDRAQKQAVTDMLQKSVDSATFEDLSKEMKNGNFEINKLLVKFLESDSGDHLDPELLGAFQKYAQKFQTPYQIKSQAITSADVYRMIEESNAWNDKIQKSGGKLGPMQSILSLFAGKKPLRFIAGYDNHLGGETYYRAFQAGMDGAGREAVRNAYKGKFEMEDGVYRGNLRIKPGLDIDKAEVADFVKKVRKASADYNQVYWERKNKKVSEEEARDMRKQITSSIQQSWEEKKADFSQDERDAISFYLTVSHDANLSMSSDPIYFQKNLKENLYYLYRLENIFNEASPKIARIYNEAVEGYHGEDIKPSHTSNVPAENTRDTDYRAASMDISQRPRQSETAEDLGEMSQEQAVAMMAFRQKQMGAAALSVRDLLRQNKQNPENRAKSAIFRKPPIR